MHNPKEQITPVGKFFAILTKHYLNAFSKKLCSLPFERYYYPLWVIAQNEGKITSKQLTDILQTDKVIVVRIIKYLMEKELIERIQHPVDKRSFLLKVTQKGTIYVPMIEKAMIDTDKEFIDIIPKENRTETLSGITDLVNNLDPIKDSRFVLEFKRLNK
ncbi:hypothetical protein CW751_04550 [Brumimicrobium salinarum]|uniref:HTH marR-type domain-containing protein n=1 Tax=Brumimicrobium salinarum TaxID=2058658 RepID=A0A2I0R425_9FLAO|nr:MarR family transcriptional regulator [Brumimicrobium salinarum]PKR81331.1 hypothetical protein CW751_04550 [Brumimicrobium salinarum]